MPVQLVLRDGSPYWYLSPDIWVVPGATPMARSEVLCRPPGRLWAHVATTQATRTPTACVS